MVCEKQLRTLDFYWLPFAVWNYFAQCNQAFNISKRSSFIFLLFDSILLLYRCTKNSCSVFDDPCARGRAARDGNGKVLFCDKSLSCSPGYYCHIGAAPTSVVCCPTSGFGLFGFLAPRTLQSHDLSLWKLRLCPGVHEILHFLELFGSRSTVDPLMALIANVHVYLTLGCTRNNH